MAVLAGGRASRLGGTKPGTALGRLPLIAYSLAAAREASLEAVVVAKRDTLLPPLDCVVICDRARDHHPLQGLIEALDYAARSGTQRSCVTVACDMPFVTAPLLAWLAREEPTGSLHGSATDQALVTEAGGHLQPLLARYQPHHRAALASALAEECSLTAAVRALRPRIVGELQLRRFGEPQRLCFSVNSEQDLALARSWLRADGMR